RGITVIMNSGFITDTILNWGEMALSGVNSIFFILLTYLLYLPLSFLIPSSSGLATLSIPIMVPLGEFTNISSALIITAFQSASGLVNLLTPTSAVVMGGLAVAHIPYDRWLKYVVKLVAIVLILTMAFLAMGALL
ncbi:MAG: YfcC family protein, partial [Peptococcaceae bacterium]|nr:YfcC family protein [Peptococcaceae bacterium]